MTAKRDSLPDRTSGGRSRVADALRDEFGAWIAGHPNAAMFDWKVAAENVLRAADTPGAVEENRRLRCAVVMMRSRVEEGDGLGAIGTANGALGDRPAGGAVAMGRNAYSELREILRGQFRPLTDRARIDASHLIGAMERGDFEQEAEIRRLREIIATGEDWGEQYLREMDERKRQGDRAHKWQTRADRYGRALGQLEHLLSSPGEMSPDEIRAEGRRLIAETRGTSDETLAPCPICDGTGHGEPLGDQSGYIPCDSCGGTGEIDADTARRYLERSGALRDSLLPKEGTDG